MIKTKSLSVYGIQSNMVGSTIINTVMGSYVKVMLANGKVLEIICKTKDQAEKINFLLHNLNPNNCLNASQELDFEFNIKFK